MRQPEEHAAGSRHGMRRALVTGAGGFVGRHVTRRLAAAGWSVVGTVHRSRPAERVAGVSLAAVDLAAPGPLPAPLAAEAQFDAIVHCAAAIPAAVPDETELYERNVAAMERVLEIARRVGTARLVSCSSMAAFGNIETDVVHPATPSIAPGAYGRAKLEGERLLGAAAAATSGLAALSIRLPGVVGLGSHDNFLSSVMAAILAGRPVTARNPDALFNNIVHVDDLAGFLIGLLDTLPPGHRMTTIAADKAIPIRRVIACMYEVAGRAETVRWEVGGRPFLISPEPARALGFAPPDTADSVRRFARDCVDGGLRAG